MVLGRTMGAAEEVVDRQKMASEVEEEVQMRRVASVEGVAGQRMKVGEEEVVVLLTSPEEEVVVVGCSLKEVEVQIGCSEVVKAERYCAWVVEAERHYLCQGLWAEEVAEVRV